MVCEFEGVGFVPAGGEGEWAGTEEGWGELRTILLCLVRWVPGVRLAWRWPLGVDRMLGLLKHWRDGSTLRVQRAYGLWTCDGNNCSP